MKKIILAALLAALGLTLTTPAQAAPPSATHSVQQRTANAQSQETDSLTPVPAGRYVISNAAAEQGTGLGVGPVPHVFPPVDVPLRYFSGQYVHRWLVESDGQGHYTIKAGQAEEYDYAFVEQDGVVSLSALREPGRWTLDPAGGDKVTIGVPGQNRVATLDQSGDGFPVQLAQRDGSPEQAWTLTRAGDLD